MSTCVCINVGSNNGFLPDGTKPLFAPILTNNQWVLGAFTCGLFYWKYWRYLFDKLQFNIAAALSWGQCVLADYKYICIDYTSCTSVFIESARLRLYDCLVIHYSFLVSEKHSGVGTCIMARKCLPVVLGMKIVKKSRERRMIRLKMMTFACE